MEKVVLQNFEKSTEKFFIKKRLFLRTILFKKILKTDIFKNIWRTSKDNELGATGYFVSKNQSSEIDKIYNPTVHFIAKNSSKSWVT